MDNLNLTVANTISSQMPLETTSPPRDALDSQKEKFAKDFESILIQKLLEEMKNTIGEWGYEQDGASEQVQGLFWMNLSRDLGEKGGLGLWKDIYQSLGTNNNPSNTTEWLDDTL